MVRKYSEQIYRIVGYSIGAETLTEEIKDHIDSMSCDIVFHNVCQWEGLINYSEKIKGWVEEIYGVELKDRECTTGKTQEMKLFLDDKEVHNYETDQR